MGLFAKAKKRLSVWLQKLAEKNREEFGPGRLNCCDLKKKPDAQRTQVKK